MNRRSFLATAALGSVALVVGCGPKAPYQVVPISGVATYNGQPLPVGFTVQLEPPDGSRASVGVIREGGKFEMVHTTAQKGAKTGSNTVRVYWNDPPEINPVPDEYKKLMAKYGFGGTENMTVEITKKDTNFKIDFVD